MSVPFRQGDAVLLSDVFEKQQEKNMSVKAKREKFRKVMAANKALVDKQRSAIDKLKETYSSNAGMVFSECARMVNPCEQIGAVAKQKVVSRAHFKLAEMIVRFGLLDDVDIAGPDPLTVAFLCEAPGGFVEFMGRWFIQQSLQKATSTPFDEREKLRNAEWKGYCISLLEEREVTDGISASTFKWTEVPNSLASLLPSVVVDHSSGIPKRRYSDLDQEEEEELKKPIIQSSKEKQVPPPRKSFRPTSPSLEVVKEFEMNTTVTFEEVSQTSNTQNYNFEKGGSLGTTIRIPASYGTVTLGGDSESREVKPDFSIPSTFVPSSPSKDIDPPHNEERRSPSPAPSLEGHRERNSRFSPYMNLSKPPSCSRSMSMLNEQSLIRNSPPRTIYDQNVEERKKQMALEAELRKTKFSALTEAPISSKEDPQRGLHSGDTSSIFENNQFSLQALLTKMKAKTF